MALTGFDHLVIRVKDIEAGIATYRDGLGLELERTDESEALGIKQAFFQLPGGGFVELVAPTDPESAVGRALESRGEGIHTMAMEVDDLESTVAAMRDAGIKLIGEGGPQVFVHPKSTHGILLQLTPKS
jgi:methylmalonyl-CoA epimerase